MNKFVLVFLCITQLFLCYTPVLSQNIPSKDQRYLNYLKEHPGPSDVTDYELLLQSQKSKSEALPFFDNFENGVGAWSSTGFFNLVESAEQYYVLSPDISPNLVVLPDDGRLPTAASGIGMWWFGEVSTGTFIGSDFSSISQSELNGGTSTQAQTGSLITPPISLEGTTGATLGFKTWWEIEGVDVDSYDLMYVEVSTDGGNSFVGLGNGTINPLNDVDGQSWKSYSSGGLGKKGVWLNQLFDLSAYAGNIVHIRFRFDTRDALYNGFRGWFIDDVSITAEGLPSPIILTIDPSTSSSGQIVEIIGENFVNGATVTVGSTVASAIISTNTALVTVPFLETGMYDVTLTNPDGQFTTIENGLTITDKLPPDIQTVAPKTAKSGESIEVVITGQNFDPGAVVTIGGAEIIDAVVQDITTVTGKSPISLDPGIYNVRVTNEDGQYDQLISEFEITEGEIGIKGSVRDVWADIFAGVNLSEPLPGTTVILLDGLSTVASVNTNSEGFFQFDPEVLEEEKEYRLQLNETAGPPMEMELTGILPSSTSIEIYFPQELHADLEKVLESLYNLEIQGKFFEGSFTAKDAIEDGYDLNRVEDLFENWQKLSQSYPDEIDAMNRALLTLSVSESYFEESNRVSGKAAKALYNTLKGVMGVVFAVKNLEAKVDKYITDNPDSFFNQVIKDLVVSIRVGVFNFIDTYVFEPQLVKLESDPTQAQLAQRFRILKKSIELIFIKENGGLAAAEEAARDFAALKVSEGLAENFYIPRTQDAIDGIGSKLDPYSGSGSFAQAASKSTGALQSTQIQTDEALALGEAFESTSETINDISAIAQDISVSLALSGIGAPVAAKLYAMSKALKVISVTGDGAALVIYGKRYVEVTNEMPGAVNQGINPFRRLPSDGELHPIHFEVDLSNLKSLVADYNSKLNDLNASFSSSDFGSASNNIGELIAIDEELSNEIMGFRLLMSSLVPNGMIQVPDFELSYDQTAQCLTENETLKMVLNLQLLAIALNPQDVESKSDLSDNLNAMSISNQAIAGCLEGTLNLLKDISGPEYIYLSKSELFESDGILRVRATFKNFGVSTSPNIKVNFEPTNEVQLNIQSASISTLDAGEEKTIEFGVEADEDVGDGFAITYSYEDVNALSSTSYYTIPEQNQVTGLKELERSKIQVYPNPSREVLYVDFPNEEFSLEIINTLGQNFEVRETLELKHQRIVDISQLEAGLYILRVNTKVTSHEFRFVKED